MIEPGYADCLFCNLAKERILNETPAFLIVADKYPVSLGHLLIVIKRHRELLCELSMEEWLDLQDAIRIAQGYVEEKYGAKGFNVGINDGATAGQTIPHLHVHLIPRYQDDVEDPRGGIRWLFPAKARYWRDSK
jgi:diadenosine tetraphosphate (Ap4A) HIT family hydrolase